MTAASDLGAFRHRGVQTGFQRTQVRLQAGFSLLLELHPNPLAAMTTLLHKNPEMPQNSRALVPIQAGVWLCKKLQISADGRLSVRFAAPETEASFDLDLQKATAEKPATRGLKFATMSVRGRLELATKQRQQEASALVRAIANAVDARLQQNPHATLAEALGRDVTPRQVRFSRTLLLDWLGPDWAPQTPLPGGWHLHDVFPASQLRHSEVLTLAVELRHTDARRVVLLVGQRGQKSVLAQTTHLDLEHLTLGNDPGPDGSALLTLLCFTLQLRDHPALTMEFPSVAEDLAALPAPEPVDVQPEKAVNLAIPADCQQNCAFCTALAAQPPDDGGTGRFNELAAELRKARQAGAGTVRFNGYDPLAFSRILDLMHLAVALDYRQAEIWSPCTRLANAEFRANVLAALPMPTRFFVPIYGPTAEIHDDYVQKSGAFAQIEAAVHGLKADRGPECVQLTSVLTKTTVNQLLPLRLLAQKWEVALNWHLPFPTTESPDDRYADEVLPFAQAGDALADLWAKHRLRPEIAGLPPCVLEPRMRAQGARLRDWLTVETSRHNPAAAYREKKYQHSADALGSQDTRVAPIVACPHAEECALAVACSRTVLRAYVQRFGLEELQPVGLERVVGM